MSVAVSKIKTIVAEHYGVPALALDGSRGSRHTILCRNVAMYLTRRLTRHSSTRIATLFKRDGHVAVLRPVREIEIKVARDPLFAQEIEVLIERVKKSSTTDEIAQRACIPSAVVRQPWRGSRSTTATSLGDPLPGRSARDKREAETAPAPGVVSSMFYAGAHSTAAGTREIKITLPRLRCLERESS